MNAVRYEIEVKNAYLRALDSAKSLERSDSRRDFRATKHYVSEYSPTRPKSKEREGESDSLFGALSESDKRTYKTAYAHLQHKTPSHPRIIEDTHETAQYLWMKSAVEATSAGGDIRPIITLGPKGSGKTTALNLLIRNANNNYEKEKFLIIRGSAQEYFRIGEEFFGGGAQPAWPVSEYMKFHAVHLFVYMRDKSPFKHILDAIKNEDFSEEVDYEDVAHPIQRIRREKGSAKVSDLVDVIEKQINEMKTDGFPFSEQLLTYNLVKRVRALEVKGASPRFQTSWPLLWSALDRFFDRNNVSIFFAFDALDNVWSFGEKETAAYKATIEALASDLEQYYRPIINKDRNGGIRYFYIVACRPETFEELSKATIRITNDECLFRYRAQAGTDEAEQLIADRFSRVRAAVLGLQQQSHARLHNGKFTNALIGNEFLEHVEHLANESGLSFQDIFSHNTRAVVANFLSFAVFVAFYASEQNKGRLPPNLTEYHLFLRNLFFGGRKLIRTTDWTHRFQWKHSIVFPNIFNFDLVAAHGAGSDVSDIRNPILLAHHVLELVESGTNSESQLESAAVNELGYDPVLVRNTIHQLLQFRLIEPRIPAPGELVLDSSIVGLPSIRALYHIIGRNPDILAYLAFDSLLRPPVREWLFNQIDLTRISREYVSIITQVSIRFLAYLNAVSSEYGGRGEPFSLDQYLPRLDHLLRELERDQGADGVKRLLASIS